MFSPNYIYVHMQYNYVVSKLHLCPNAVLFCRILITFRSKCSTIMLSPIYIYVPIQYNYVVS